MNGSTWARTGIAGAVAGLGLAVGGVAIASADSTETAGPATAAHDAGRHLDGGRLATVLAEELGLDEDAVAEALRTVHEDLRPDRPDLDEGGLPEPPNDEELLAELRDRLVERLDAAVEDGTLTEADKTSVLKAYDAEVIGGFGGGPHGHGSLGGPMREGPTT